MVALYGARVHTGFLEGELHFIELRHMGKFLDHAQLIKTTPIFNIHECCGYDNSDQVHGSGRPLQASH